MAPTLLTKLLSCSLRNDQDVVACRQRAREIAARLGFSLQDQAKIGTALSEIARNVVQYAGSGEATFNLINGAEPEFEIIVEDHGPGIRNIQSILDGRGETHPDRAGMGLISAKRLMGHLAVQSAPGQGTRVRVAKKLSHRHMPLPLTELTELTRALDKGGIKDPFAEIRNQNRELIQALEELTRKQEELREHRLKLELLNQELTDTNRGVIALNIELEERAQAIRMASETKSRFLSHVTHEFRTPVNSILSLTRLLELHDGAGDAEERLKQIRFIRKSAENLSDMINDLLDSAKMEAGLLEATGTAIRVSELFGTLRGMFRPLVMESEVDLIFVESDDIPVFHNDEAKLAQILRNLISNALKFTEKGSVTVSAEQSGPHTVAFYVSDTGIGIPPEEHERIFEEFTQVRCPLQAKARGTGLGLPLSKRLAQLLGGTLTLESTPGKGSTFRVEVTTQLGKAKGRITHQADPHVVLAPKDALLLIDDDEVARYLLADILRKRGFKVVEAESGEAGLCKARMMQPLAIFLDLHMPVMDGNKVMQTMQGDPSLRDIPVIIYTSDNRAEQKLTSRPAGLLSKDVLKLADPNPVIAKVLERIGCRAPGSGGEKEAFS